MIVKNLYFSLLVLMLFWASTSSAEDIRLSVATYNIDGLPLELAGIKINPDGPAEEGTRKIAQKLEEREWDVLGLNEDFNFHTQVVEGLTSYSLQTYKGNIRSSLAIATSILFRRYRFDADGLELATRSGIGVSNETIIPWNNDAVYGYFTNDNDSLTKKGFRYYTVTLPEGCSTDLIILHADAGGDRPDIMARENGMSQLYDFISQKIESKDPLIVMGDFNCFYSRDRLKELFIDRLNAIEGITVGDACRDLGVAEEIDKILYLNRKDADYTIVPVYAELVNDFTKEDGSQLSDHRPVTATFKFEDNYASSIKEIGNRGMSAAKCLENGNIVVVRGSIKYDHLGRRL